jgi:DNA polymerase-4
MVGTGSREAKKKCTQPVSLPDRHRRRVYLYLSIPNLPALLSEQHIPQTEGRPLAVVSDTGERGVVRAVNQPAQALGIRPGHLVRNIRRPGIDLIPEQPVERMAVVQELKAMLHEYTPEVRVRGESAFLLDLTGTERLWGNADEVSSQLLQRLTGQWKLAASIGTGPTRTVARMAARSARCPGRLVIGEDMVAEFLRDQPVTNLPGVGPKTQRRLARYGIRTIGELAEVPAELLTETFGGHRGILLNRLSQGLDVESLRVEKAVTSLHRETVLPEDTLETGKMEAFAAYLCGRLAHDLRRRRLSAARLTVYVQHADGLPRRMNQTLPAATSLETELTQAVRPLLRRLASLRRVRVAKIGVSVSRLRPSRSERKLFDLRDTDRQEAVAEDVCRVRQRYGYRSILPARAHSAVA